MTRQRWAVLMTGSVALLLVLHLARAQGLREWEHGWETGRVRATRYLTDTQGYSIGFTSPTGCAWSDRVELRTFLEQAGGGTVWQMGGAPCAEVMVRFPDVNTREEANAKLQTFLPQLDAFVRQWWW